jgi:FkbM family methyltransferase
MNLIPIKKIIKACKILMRVEYCKAFFSGAAAAVEHETLLKNIPCKTIIDIGANRGQFSLVARRCFKDAQIIAFEPLPRPFKVLQNIFAHDRRVTLYQMAVGSASSSQQIHISQRDDSSSLLPITELQNKVFPGTKEKAIIDIDVKPLDSMLQKNSVRHPALLKIDVQGYELEVLKGCKGILSLLTYVYVECSYQELYQGQPLANEIISFMNQRGFDLKGVYNTSYDALGRAIQSDIFFEVAK